MSIVIASELRSENAAQSCNDLIKHEQTQEVSSIDLHSHSKPNSPPVGGKAPFGNSTGLEFNAGESGDSQGKLEAAATGCSSEICRTAVNATIDLSTSDIENPALKMAITGSIFIFAEKANATPDARPGAELDDTENDLKDEFKNESDGGQRVSTGDQVTTPSLTAQLKLFLQLCFKSAESSPGTPPTKILDSVANNPELGLSQAEVQDIKQGAIEAEKEVAEQLTPGAPGDGSGGDEFTDNDLKSTSGSSGGFDGLNEELTDAEPEQDEGDFADASNDDSVLNGEFGEGKEVDDVKNNDVEDESMISGKEGGEMCEE